MDRVQIHKEICEELNKIYAQKNHDYGNSFGETFDKLGIISAITRISDKYNRLCALATKPEEERQVKDESITDTLLDMANYCIMTVIEMHKDENNENDNKTANQKSSESCEHSWEFIYVHHNHPNYQLYRCKKCGATDERLINSYNG